LSVSDGARSPRGLCVGEYQCRPDITLRLAHERAEQGTEVSFADLSFSAETLALMVLMAVGQASLADDVRLFVRHDVADFGVWKIGVKGMPQIWFTREAN
jgi:hypothetical protein